MMTKAPGNWTPTRYSGGLAIGAVKGYAKTGCGWSMVVRVAQCGDVIFEGAACKPGPRHEKSDAGLTWKLEEWPQGAPQPAIVESGTAAEVKAAKEAAEGAWNRWTNR